MADFPAIPLWTDAYLADTRHLTTLEHGAYLLLLMEAWRRPTRSLPDDDKMLARLAGLSADEWAAIKDIVLAFWKRDGRTKAWSQKRLSLEADYVRSKSISQRNKAAKRWKEAQKGDAAAMPDPCPEDAPTPTPTPTPTPVSDVETSSTSHPRKRASRLAPDWVPGALPASVTSLVAQWPPGREQREMDGFRDYWTSRSRDAAKLDWDRTWHNRIRDQHDRIMRETRRDDRQPTIESIGRTASAAIRAFGAPERGER